MIKINPNIFNGITHALNKMKSEFAPVANYRQFGFKLAIGANNIVHGTDNLISFMHDFLHTCQREAARIAMREAGVSGSR